VVQWVELVALVETHIPRAKTGRPPFPIETMLRTHVMHDWLALSDQAMEEAFANASLYRNFAG
jgi:IS5 family transposase